MARSVMEHTTETFLVGDDGMASFIVSQCSSSCTFLSEGEVVFLTDLAKYC